MKAAVAVIPRPVGVRVTPVTDSVPTNVPKVTEKFVVLVPAVKAVPYTLAGPLAVIVIGRRPTTPLKATYVMS